MCLDIDGLMALLSKHIEQTAGKLYADLNEEIECSIELRLNSLDLVPSFTERSVTLPSWKSPHQTQQTPTWYQTGGSWDKVVTIARSAKLAGSGGSMVGRIVGGILGGIIGFVAGGIGILPGAGLGSMIG